MGPLLATLLSAFVLEYLSRDRVFSYWVPIVVIPTTFIMANILQAMVMRKAKRSSAATQTSNGSEVPE